MNAHVEAFGPGVTVEWLRTTYRILLTPAETEGRLGMFEAVVPPGAGPARHIHHREDETIYLIEGEALFWYEGRTFQRRSGDVTFVPRGKEHGFRVTGASPARFVTTVTPGGLESFFATAARLGLKAPADQAEIAAVARQFHCEFTGAPPP